MKAKVNGKVFTVVFTLVLCAVAFYLASVNTYAYKETYTAQPGQQLYNWTVMNSGYYSFGIYGASAATSKTESTSRGTHGGNGGGIQVNEFLNAGDTVGFYCGLKGNGGASDDSQYRGGEMSYVIVNGSVLAVAGAGGGAGRTMDGYDGGTYYAPGVVYDTGKYRENANGEDSLGDGAGSSGGSGAHGGKAGENTLHEHTDACYSNEWVTSGGGTLYIHDARKPNAPGNIYSWNAADAPVIEHGAYIDVSDQKEIRMCLRTGDDGSIFHGHGGYAWGGGIDTFDDPGFNVSRFWVEDQDGNVIWEVPDLLTYMRANGTIEEVSSWVQKPSGEHPDRNAYESVISDALDERAAVARQNTPECFAIFHSGGSFKTWEWDKHTGWTEKWGGTSGKLLLYVMFHIDIPDGVTSVRANYKVKYPGWRDNESVWDQGVWDAPYLQPPQYRKLTCGYSHAAGGTMGENKGAYGGTSTANRGVVLGSSVGVNEGEGYVVCEEIPIKAIIKYSNNGTESGSMADTTVTGNLSEMNIKLAANQYGKRGHSFIGWSLVPGGPVVASDGSSINISVSPYAPYLDHSTYGQVVLTLYPVFEVNKYRLYFNMGDPRNSDNASVASRIPQVFAGYPQEGGRYYKEVTYGQKIGDLPDPSLIGWNFSGWYLENKRRITSSDVWTWTSSVEVTP